MGLLTEMMERWTEVKVDLEVISMVVCILMVREEEVVMTSCRVRFVQRIMEFGRVESFKD